MGCCIRFVLYEHRKINALYSKFDFTGAAVFLKHHVSDDQLIAEITCHKKVWPKFMDTLTSSIWWVSAVFSFHLTKNVQISAIQHFLSPLNYAQTQERLVKYNRKYTVPAVPFHSYCFNANDMTLENVWIEANGKKTRLSLIFACCYLTNLNETFD